MLTHIIIMKALSPGNQTQHRENLRLNLQRNVEIRRDVVCAERDPGAGPEEHH